MDSVVDEYFVVLEKLGDHIEEIDEQILAVPDRTHMKELHRLKREILFLRKAVWPLREDFDIEKSGSRLVGDSIKPFLAACTTIPSRSSTWWRPTATS